MAESGASGTRGFRFQGFRGTDGERRWCVWHTGHIPFYRAVSWMCTQQDFIVITRNSPVLRSKRLLTSLICSNCTDSCGVEYMNITFSKRKNLVRTKEKTLHYKNDHAPNHIAGTFEGWWPSMVLLYTTRIISRCNRTSEVHCARNSRPRVWFDFCLRPCRFSRSRNEWMNEWMSEIATTYVTFVPSGCL